MRAGNAGPKRRNLARYLRQHSEYEVYDGQDGREAAARNGAGAGVAVHVARPVGASRWDGTDELTMLIVRDCWLCISTFESV